MTTPLTPARLAEIQQFLKAKREAVAVQLKWRRESAKMYRTGTDDEWRKGAQLAAKMDPRMKDRRIDSRSERLQLAERDDRIAGKYEAEIEAYDQAVALLAEVQRLQQENEQLHDWRATVTAALRREGGVFYEDVQKHIRELVRDRDRLHQELDEARQILTPNGLICAESTFGQELSKQYRESITAARRDQREQDARKLDERAKSLRALAEQQRAVGATWDVLDAFYNKALAYEEIAAAIRGQEG